MVTDARRREVYWAAYDGSGCRLEGPDVQRPTDLAGRLTELGVTHAAGHGAEMHADLLGLPVVGPATPSPLGLVGAARLALIAGTTPSPLVPLYLRRPDAVEPAARKRVSQR